MRIKALLVVALVGLVACGDATSTPKTVQLYPLPQQSIPTTTTTVAPATTTTTTVPPVTLGDIGQAIDDARATWGRCGEWHDLAISVGWTEDEWPVLSRVLYRESRCTPDAWNGHDAGLVQINQIHTEWIESMGWSHPDSMFDPALNLRFAKMLKDSSGWSPWAWLEMP